MQAENDPDEIPHNTIDLLLFSLAHEKTEDLLVDGLKGWTVEADDICCDDDSEEDRQTSDDALKVVVSEVEREDKEAYTGMEDLSWNLPAL